MPNFEGQHAGVEKRTLKEQELLTELTSVESKIRVYEQLILEMSAATKLKEKNKNKHSFELDSKTEETVVEIENKIEEEVKKAESLRNRLKNLERIN